MNDQSAARIIRVDRGQYTVAVNGTEKKATLAGKLRHMGIVPIIGDYVDIKDSGENEAVITRVRERRGCLSRPDGSGHADGYVKTLVEQVMAANLDYLFIICSLNDDFSVNRIARFAATSVTGGCIPVVILTKADLCPDREAYLDRIREMNPTLDVFCVSSVTGEGLERVRGYVKPGVTVGLMGSSGVGKSTLINTLAGRNVMKVSAIRESDSKGRHTTSHREMINVDGTYFIDTPGMREFGLCGVAEGLNETFADILEIIYRCRFSDCSHKKEPGCAVRAALEDGSLSGERWSLYCSLLCESDRAEAMSAKKRTAAQKIAAGR